MKGLSVANQRVFRVKAKSRKPVFCCACEFIEWSVSAASGYTEGDLGMSVGKDGVQQVLTNLNIKDGSMLVSGYDRIDVPSGQLKSVMRDGKVELEHIALDLGTAGNFDLNGVRRLVMHAEAD